MSAAVKPGVKPSRELCIMACAFCRDPLFWAWLTEAHVTCSDAERAKTWILFTCGATSRKQLDTEQNTAQRFHQLVRAPFVLWRQERQDREYKADWSAA